MLSKNNGNERLLVLSRYDINDGNPVFLDTGNHKPMALFGNNINAAAIGSEGEIILIIHESKKKSPNSPLEVFSLPGGEKASSVAFYLEIFAILSTT